MAATCDDYGPTGYDNVQFGRYIQMSKSVLLLPYSEYP
jgi:hypothetical protein